MLGRSGLPTSVVMPGRLQERAESPGGCMEPPLQSTVGSREASLLGGLLGLIPQIPPVCVHSRTYHDLIHCKTSVCTIMRAKFYSVAQEAGFCLQDKMEILMK